MAALDASIILQGQPVNMLGILDASNRMAGEQKDRLHQQEYRNMLATNGAGIMSGDQNALNALAGFDPMAALGVQQTRLGMDAQRQSMEHQNRSFELEAQKYAASLSADERQAQAQQIEEAVRMGMAIPDAATWDAFMQQQAPELVGAFDQREMLAQRYMTMADILKRQDAAGAGPEWVAATPEQAAAYGASAGQINQRTGEFKRTPKDSNMVIESTPGGGFRFVQGADADAGRMKPSDPVAMIASIDGILNDPALEHSTGMLSVLQKVPGTPQRRFGARARQLEGQAFLQAFESLKGGGQITEIEGVKATQAIGRLDTAQSAADYREALTELRDILTAAQARPQGWAFSQEGAGATAQPAPAAPSGGGPVQITNDADYDDLPSGTEFIAPDGTVRRKP